jgi:hypothetical protein
MTKARVNADNASADIQGVTAGTGLTGGGTSGTVTLTNDMATVIDAKGDLVVGTGADTYDNLAAGSNGDTLVADSSTSTGLRYTSSIGQNPVINSAFQIAQRGTSFSGGASSTYALDRWVMYPNTAMRVSQQSTNDTTNLPFIQFCARVGRVSGNSTTTAVAFDNIFETVNSRPFVGKTVTLSFYARKGADFSGAGSILPSELICGTGTDQNLSTGFTGQTNVINGTALLTTTWQRFSFTATIASTFTQLAIRNYYIPSGTAGAADYYEITGVQLDIGSVALPFRTYAATIQGELDACNRYYQRWNIASFTKIGTGVTYDATNIFAVVIPMKTNMRAAPSLFTAGLAAFDGVATYTATIGNNLSTANNICMDLVVAGATAPRVQQVGGNNTANAYFEASAEL